MPQGHQYRNVTVLLLAASHTILLTFAKNCSLGGERGEIVNGSTFVRLSHTSGVSPEKE